MKEKTYTFLFFGPGLLFCFAATSVADRFRFNAGFEPGAPFRLPGVVSSSPAPAPFNSAVSALDATSTSSPEAVAVASCSVDDSSGVDESDDFEPEDLLSDAFDPDDFEPDDSDDAAFADDFEADDSDDAAFADDFEADDSDDAAFAKDFVPEDDFDADDFVPKDFEPEDLDPDVFEPDDLDCTGAGESVGLDSGASSTGMESRNSSSSSPSGETCSVTILAFAAAADAFEGAEGVDEDDLPTMVYVLSILFGQLSGMV